MRLNFEAEDFPSAQQYLWTRARQVLAEGFRVTCPPHPVVDQGVEWGCGMLLSGGGCEYQVIYPYRAYRGQGRVLPYLQKRPNHVVLTLPSCKIESFLTQHHILHRVVARHTEWVEYKLIEQFYQDRKAIRSGLYYMNHIDEGLVVMRDRGASEEAQRAFCLHPMFQSDEDLPRGLEAIQGVGTLGPKALLLAMEYRNIANQTLSSRNIQDVTQIPLSPLREVQEMLVADKVQNYKDFLLCHYGRHPRSAELVRYFQNWLLRLGIPRGEFSRLFRLLCLEPPQNLDQIVSDDLVECKHPHLKVGACDQTLGVECKECGGLLAWCWMDEHIPEALWNRAEGGIPCERSREDYCAICEEPIRALPETHKK